VRPETYVEASHLLRILYEREYGVGARKADTDKAIEEARLADRYAQAKHHMPIDPDYIPE
jgi:hypothetical protein